MSAGFLNAAFLFGLLALAVPVAIHLISRRKYDVVQWGAMQFLELGRRTRRRIRFEEMLLMFLRMGLIAILVLALARPWSQGGPLGAVASRPARDVVLVLDGSYSMGWEGKAETPRAAAIQWAHTFLEQARGGDTLLLLDAHDQARRVIGSPTSDFQRAGLALDELPPPSGTSNLVQACGEACQLLSLSSNVSRQVVVLTDGQSLPWHVADETAWRRVDDLRQQPAVRPELYVVDVTQGAPRDGDNFFVERLELSRELTVPDFPIRARTSVAQTGDVAVQRRVAFAVNGQRLDDRTVSITVPPRGRVSVEFEHRFATAGSYVVSVLLDDDNLPADNRSDAALVVARAVPALLIDGDPHVDPVLSETFFVRAALTAAGNQTPWVVAKTITAEELTPAAWNGPAVVLLANVPRLSDAQWSALTDFVKQGGGLIVAPGNRVDADDYNAAARRGLLPDLLSGTGLETDHTLRPIRIAPDSLDSPWLGRFRTSAGVDLLQARFAQWWKLQPVAAADARIDSPATDTTGIPARGELQNSEAVVQARLATGDPLIVSRGYGEGLVVQLAIPLDADWSTLPSRNDFVPLLHELVFQLAGHPAGRNVEVGSPLQFRLPRGQKAGDWTFSGPGGLKQAADRGGDELRPVARLEDTPLAGIYRATHKDAPDRAEYFVADFDRAESDLALLDADDRQQLSQDGRLHFVASLEQYSEAVAGETPRSELWRFLMLGVLGLLVFEVLMTRRLVRRGHGREPEAGEPAAQEPEAGAPAVAVPEWNAVE